MIAPLVDEEVWLETLRYSPRWYPPAKPTVVIAPHPDDETLGAGGLIAEQRSHGIPVSVVCVTDGEAAYADAPGLAAIRTIEQQLALETLGVPNRDISRLHLPDSNLAAHESELEAHLDTLIYADTLVIAPWTHDWHPDHEACGRVAEKVAHAKGAQLVFYIFWTWHQATTDSLRNTITRCFELDHQLLALKQTALHRHRSQLYRETGSPILPENLLKPAKRPFETFLFHD